MLQNQKKEKKKKSSSANNETKVSTKIAQEQERENVRTARTVAQLTNALKKKRGEPLPPAIRKSLKEDLAAAKAEEKKNKKNRANKKSMVTTKVPPQRARNERCEQVFVRASMMKKIVVGTRDVDDSKTGAKKMMAAEQEAVSPTRTPTPTRAGMARFSISTGESNRRDSVESRKSNRSTGRDSVQSNKSKGSTKSRSSTKSGGSCGEKKKGRAKQAVVTLWEIAKHVLKFIFYESLN